MPAVLDSDGISVRKTNGPAMTAEAPRWHEPVMVNEVLEYLNPHPGQVVVDCTVGTAGHSLLIVSKLLPDGRLVIIDRDEQSLVRASERLIEFSSMVTAVHDNYRNLPAVLLACGLQRVDGVLLDLGMSSPQVDQPGRGFSFLKEGPLDMRMDQTQALTAEGWINSAAESEIADALFNCAEERFSRRIASNIARERKLNAITTTKQLADLVVRSYPASARHGRIHPATRTFQALRMIVNDELGGLEEVLQSLHAALNPGGRAVVITFHSLEDRMVKQAFRRGSDEGIWKLLKKKVVKPSDEECARNSRARSAKLRAVERLG